MFSWLSENYRKRCSRFFSTMVNRYRSYNISSCYSLYLIYNILLFKYGLTATSPDSIFKLKA